MGTELRRPVGGLGVAAVTLVVLHMTLAVVPVEACPGARRGRALAVLHHTSGIPFGSGDSVTDFEASLVG